MIHFTHNDLDALGCTLVLGSVFNFDTSYHTNYSDFDQKVDEIVANTDSDIIISDLSFAERPEQLHRILECKNNVILIDHHSYTENFFDQFKNTKLKYYVETDYCAAKLSFQIFKHFIKDNSNLKDLVDIIDIYDTWKVTYNFFSLSQKLNDWFWTKDFFDLEKEIRSRNFKLPVSFKEESKEIQKKFDELVKEAYDNKFVQKFGPVVFVIGTNVFNKILLKEMSNETPVVVQILGSIYKIRIDQNIPKDQTEKLRLNLANKITGHPNAFSYKSKLNIEQECKRIVQQTIDIINVN